METSLVTAESIYIYRGGRKILDNVSLTVSGGDFITIIGPNGAGKTTLLKCLLGMVSPQQGEVRRADSLRVGYVPQQIIASQSIPLLLRRFLTLNKKADAAAVEEAAALTEISNCLDTPLAALSGGEMQRALLARALMDAPQLLALDEPAQNLDVSGEIAFYRLLENICDRRALAVLMVSHDLHFVMRRSRQVVCLFHHVCCSGAPKAVSQDPAFRELFGSDMARMMAVYPHDHEDHDHQSDTLPPPPSPLDRTVL